MNCPSCGASRNREATACFKCGLHFEACVVHPVLVSPLFHVLINGQVHGPLSAQIIRQIHSTGSLPSSTLVRRSDGNLWQTLASCPDFIHLFARNPPQGFWSAFHHPSESPDEPLPPRPSPSCSFP